MRSVAAVVMGSGGIVVVEDELEGGGVIYASFKSGFGSWEMIRGEGIGIMGNPCELEKENTNKFIIVK